MFHSIVLFTYPVAQGRPRVFLLDAWKPNSFGDERKIGGPKGDL